MIRAISFDLWDTLVRDDSDEPKRAARGLRSKTAERRHLLWRALEADAPIDAELVARAYDVADAAFNHVWHHQHVNWTIGERLRVLLDGLGRRLPEQAFEELCLAHARMELEVPPDLVEGAAAALAGLAEHYRLAVVSDAIVTPGWGLRELLALHGLERHFTGFAFSDEVGRSKPDRSMFEAAARQLGVAPEEMLHVGDREANDVRGPQALGMKAVLFVGARDRGHAATAADAVCERLAELPAVVDRLARQSAAV